MTIRAQKHAFACLGADPLDVACPPAQTHRELLRRGIDVVELEGAQVAVIFTDFAPAAGFLHQDLLRPPAPSRHVFRAASRASICPPPLEEERLQPVLPAVQLEGCEPRCLCLVDLADAPCPTRR